MAFKTISQTDTLETFRTTFNALSQDDFGDIANLSPAISSTNLVDAMNEVIGIATSTAGFIIEDISSTQQIIGGGETLKVLGTSNEINAIVSATDTLTIGLTSDVTISNDLIVTNNLTASGSTHTLGTIEVSGNTIRSTDSSEIQINDGLQVINPLRAGVTTINPAGSNNIESTSGFTVFGSSIVLSTNQFIAFEGSTDDTFETILNVIDPTADRTINLPDEDGTILTTGSSGVVTSAMIVNGTISTADIADAQITEAKIGNDAVGQNQLKSVVNLQILNSSGGVLKSIYGAGA